MIVFDLRCDNAHVFEAWFGSSAGFEDQRARGLVSCPICGDCDVIKAVMAPNVAAKSNSKAVRVRPPEGVSKPAAARVPVPSRVPPAITAEGMKAALLSLVEAQAKALETSQWVGRGFADRARAMHAGKEEATPIHGQSTRAEAEALLDEGVAIAPLLVPVVPPEALN
ncbi:DUF1178 family protein [Sphingomonas endolithica]|uniref:DUF1178 family protein n=1 Tax=Sphingomonas endolithica TaxID=2972485 RepID=UPI0021AE864D|nr:DUF1178 family protein [Sphingomonas sp. ZFBP2030]